MPTTRGRAIGGGLALAIDVLRGLYRVLELWSNADFLVTKIKASRVDEVLTGGAPWLDVALIMVAVLLLAPGFWRGSKQQELSGHKIGSVSNMGGGIAAGVVEGNITQILKEPVDTQDRDQLARRWRQLAPQIDHWIGAGRRIQEEMRNEADRVGTVNDYVYRLENGGTGWRTLTGKFLDIEFPDTGLRQQIVVKGTRTSGLDPFEWELERLGITIAELTRLKEHDRMTHFIHMSGKYE